MADKYFRVLTIRSAGMTAQPALYPLLSSKPGEIIDLERLDQPGLTKRYCRASGVTVSRIVDGAEQPILRVSRLKIQVYVTAGRLGLACKRYRRSSALAVAGPGAGFSATGVTRFWAGRRPLSSAIVGHIRYPWVRSVSAWPRRWPFGRETLVVEYAMAPRTPMLLRLDLKLPPALTPAMVAAEICQQVVKYWQTYDSNAPQEVQQALDNLRQRAEDDRNAAGTASPNRRLAAVYQFPAWYPVTAAVPFLSRPRQSRPDFDEDEAGEE